MLLLVLSSGILHAQTRDQLNDSLSYYFQKEEFQKALPIARRVVEMDKKGENESTTGEATALNNLGHVLARLKENTEAADVFFEALTLRLALLDPDHEDCFSSVQSLANVYKELGKFSDAAAVYSGYLKKLETKGKERTTYHTYSLYLRAVIYHSAGNIAAAEKDYLAILQREKNILSDTAVLYNTYEALVNIYNDEESITKAEKIYNGHLDWTRIVHGTENESYIYALYRIAGLYSRGKEYEKAMQIMREVSALYKKLLGEDSEQYMTTVFNQASLLGRLGDHSAADSTVKLLVEYKKKKYGDRSGLYENMLYRAGTGLAKGESFQQAEPYLLQSVALCRTLNDPRRLESRLGSLDSVYKEMQRPDDREPLLAEIMDLHKQYHILDDSAYSIRLAMQVDVYIKKEDYARAASMTQQLDSFSRKAFAKTNEVYVLSRQVIGNLYMLMERMDIAEKYYLEALALAPGTWSDESEELASLLKTTAEMYNSVGQYKKAATLMDRSIRILEKRKFPNNALLASVYYNSSGVHNSLRDTAAAETALRKAVEYSSRNKKGLLNTIGFARMLAVHYSRMKKEVKADSVFGEILKLTNKPGDKIYGKYISILAQQGLSLLEFGHKERAAACIRTAVQETAKFFPSEMEWEKDLVLYLSEYYRHTKEYKEAIRLGDIMLRQEKRKQGEDNPGLATTMVILTNLYLEAGDYKRAEAIISEMNRVVLNNMSSNFDVLSDSEKEKYIASKVYSLHFSNTLLLRNREVSAEFVHESINQALLLKSLILSENRKTTASILQTGDSSLQKLYQSWLSVRQQLAREFSKPVSLRRADLSTMEEKADDLQKELTRSSSALVRQQNARKLEVQDLLNKLAKDEAAIEFVAFNVFRNGADSTMYAAYIMRKDLQEPVFVPLCEKKQLQKLFDSAGTTATSMVSKFYRGTKLKNKNTAAVLGTELYKLIWQPLEPYLAGIKKISYSPAGKLYSIAFHALPVDSNTVLMDRYMLQQYTSTRQVVLRDGDDRTAPVKSIALFGNATFSLDSSQLVLTKTKSSNPVVPTRIYAPAARGTRGSSWTSLPGTAEEVRKIAKLFEENKVTSVPFVQTSATEENLKALSGNSPQVLHIATHGFFLPEPEKKFKDLNQQLENSYTLAEDPLLRSGLILAGGNYAWSGKTPIDGVEDGIATAYEISQLNLSNTELVVLSACETALGDVKGSEGVFGLQRAFKMAGVKKMIVSLWQVPDKETAELMTAFYNYWLKGKTINEAFTQAQSDMRKKYSPYYWAAFVLVE